MFPILPEKYFENQLSLCSKKEISTDKREDGMDHRITFEFNPHKPGYPEWMYEMGRYVLNQNQAKELYRETIEGEPAPGENPRVTLRVAMRAQFDKENPWFKIPETSMEKHPPEDSREYHEPIFEHPAYIKSFKTRPSLRDFQTDRGVKNPFEDRGFVLDQKVFPDLPEYKVTNTSEEYYTPLSEDPVYKESKNTFIPNYQIDLEGKVFPFEDTGVLMEETVFNDEVDPEDNFFNLLREPNKLAFPALLEVLEWEIGFTNRFYYLTDDEKKELLQRIERANASYDEFLKQRIIFEIYVTISEIRESCAITKEMERQAIADGMKTNYFGFNKENYDKSNAKFQQLKDQFNNGDMDDDAFLDQIYDYLYYLDTYEKPDEKGSAYNPETSTTAREAAVVDKRDGTFDQGPTRGTIVVTPKRDSYGNPPRRGTTVVTRRLQGTFEKSQIPSTSGRARSSSTREQTSPQSLVTNRPTETAGALSGTFEIEPTQDATPPERASKSGTAPSGTTGPRRTSQRLMKKPGHPKSKSQRPQPKTDATKRKLQSGKQNSGDKTMTSAKKKKPWR